MNLIDAAKQFATPESCVNYLEAMRWPDGVTCLQCGGSKVSRIQTNDTERTRKNAKGVVRTVKVPGRIVYQCQNPECAHQFSATTGTIFHDTHLPLDKWFAAVALMVNAKKGLSAKQLQRDLGTAYKSAWYLAHRIRKAMSLLELADEEPLTGTVEADETYIGGKYYKRRKRAKWDKPAVFGVVERDGKARTCYMPVVMLGLLGAPEARRHRLLPPDQRQAPAPLPLGISVQVEQPQVSGYIRAGSRGLSDRRCAALCEAH